MNALRVTIPGPPVPQGRGRIVKVGAFHTIKDPEKSVSWKGHASVHMQVAVGNTSWDPSAVPLRLIIRAFWPMKGQPLKRGSRPAILKATRPDADNVAKAVLDAGQGVLWNDDGQVAVLVVEKRHAAQGDAPRIELMVERIA